LTHISSRVLILPLMVVFPRPTLRQLGNLLSLLLPAWFEVVAVYQITSESCGVGPQRIA